VIVSPIRHGICLPSSAIVRSRSPSRLRRGAVTTWSRSDGVTIPAHAPRTLTRSTPCLLRHHLVSRS